MWRLIKTKMDFNKLREKKRTHWTVWVTLNDNNETTEVAYVEKKDVSIKGRNDLIVKQLNNTYGKNGWLAYNVD